MLYILIGSQHSLYTGKLRAYLQWKNLPFEEIAASQEIYKQLILPRTGVAFIPVLVCPDSTTVLQDSHAIIQQLEEQHPRFPVQPKTPKQRLASMLLELYGDEWMVIPAMHYRWNFPEQHSTYLHHQFGKTSCPDKPYQEQLAAGQRVASHFSGMLPALGVSSTTTPVIEARLKWQMAVLQQHLEQMAYLLSPHQPSTGDFGLVGPLYAHLYIDPVPGCLLKSTAHLVADWIERTCGISAVKHRAGCNNIVTIKPTNAAQPGKGPLQVIRCQQQQPVITGNVPGISSGSSSGGSGSGSSSDSSSSDGSSNSGFPAGDIVPATLLPLLHHMFLEQMPAIHSTLQLLQQWVQKQQRLQGLSQPQEQHQQQAKKAARMQVQVPPGWLLLPRSLGSHSFKLYDPSTGFVAAQGSRVAASYVAWRAAEISDWYEGLCQQDRSSVLQLLRDVTEVTRSSSAAVDGVGARHGCCEGGNSQQESTVTAACSVDAAAAFDNMVEMVHGCGRIVRVSNRIMVKPLNRSVHSKL